MAITIAASALSGTPTDDVIIGVSDGSTTTSWTIASGRYLEIPATLSVSLGVGSVGTINGALRGGGSVSAKTRTLNIGASADLSAFTGLLNTTSTSTSIGTIYFAGSAYTFPGSIVPAKGNVKFNTSSVALAQTALALNRSVNITSNLTKTTVTFKNPVFGVEYSAGVYYQINLNHDVHDVVFTDPVVENPGAYTAANVLQGKTGSGVVSFGGTNGNYRGTFKSESGTTRITGINSIGTAAKIIIAAGQLEMAHGSSHRFNTATFQNTSRLDGVGTCAMYADNPTAGGSVSSNATVTSRPDVATGSAGDLTIGTASSGVWTGRFQLAPDGGRVGGKPNIIRVRSPMRATALTINSNARLGTTPIAGQEGVVIIYARANTGTSVTGTTTVNSGSILRVNSPDGSDRLCNGLVNVLTNATLEVEYVASAAPNVRGRHVYPGGLTLGAAARLNIGVTPL